MFCLFDTHLQSYCLKVKEMDDEEYGYAVSAFWNSLSFKCLKTLSRPYSNLQSFVFQLTGFDLVTVINAGYKP